MHCGESREMKKRRVLHVLGTARYAGAAISRIIESLAKAVDSEKYEIMVCSLADGEFVDRFKQLGLSSTCVHWTGAISDPMGAARYARLLRSTNPHIIHQHTGGRLLTQMGRLLTHARIVRHVHGRASEDTGVVPDTLDLPERDVLIANSQIVADFTGDPRALVIYPGIDVSDFLLSRTPHVDVVVGTACRLEPVKGISCLIEAMAILKNEFPSLRLEIAGDGSLREALTKQAADLGVSEGVSFLGWRNNLSSLLAGWDIFVLPSLDEGFGVAALEAMAAGLPVIASAAGGLPELVCSGETGLLFPPGASTELASRLRDLINDREERLSMGLAGRQRAVQHFSVTQMVYKVFAVYDELR
jgi:glycosyltransferase involved in cell wall biosynthesis